MYVCVCVCVCVCDSPRNGYVIFAIVVEQTTSMEEELHTVMEDQQNQSKTLESGRSSTNTHTLTQTHGSDTVKLYRVKEV